jgi:hypothetical protein
VNNIEPRFNQVKLAHLVSLIGNTLPDAESTLSFFTKVLQSRVRLGVEASLCLDMDIVLVKIKLNDLETAKLMIDDAKQLLPTIKSTEAVVFSKVYAATMEFRKVFYCNISYYIYLDL